MARTSLPQLSTFAETVLHAPLHHATIISFYFAVAACRVALHRLHTEHITVTGVWENMPTDGEKVTTPSH